MSRQRVAVLMGGVSSEHDVSLRSGAKVVEALGSGSYVAIPIIIGKDGRWAYDGRTMDAFDGLRLLRDLTVNCVFLALHGPFGEDGRIQGALDLLGIPYTGSGCGASALAMDKVRCKALVEHAGVRVAPQLVIERREWHEDPARCTSAIESRLGFPCVIKEPFQGSSLHMGIPHDAAAMAHLVSELFNQAPRLMVEQYLRGPEVTCGVLDADAGKAPVALPVTEIRPVSAAYFDYVAKYTPGATEEITPAPIAQTATAKVQAMAVRVHELIGCRGLSRSDMILVDDEPVFIEVNTIPGFTETSLYPQAAAVYGLSFAQLVALLVDRALAARPAKVSA